MAKKKKTETDIRKQFKRGVLTLLALSVAALIGAAALVIYVDPFFHYHSPLPGFPYLIDNQLSQNPGMAKHLDYDSVILGSSMTFNFQTTWFQELMDLNTIKLCYSAAYPKDQSNIMELIFQNHSHAEGNDLDTVFLGIDVFTYTAGIEETKYPIPEYLYDDHLLNDVNYIWNKDIILNYILRPIADPDPTDLSNVYASWWTEEYYSKDYVLRNYVSPEQAAEETDPEVYLQAVERNLTSNICPYIEQNPRTKFVVFFPPYSILFWDRVLKENHLEATIEEYRYIANRLNAYDNVEVYFFPDREEIICNLDNYADYTHYHPRYNRYMTECFVSGENLVAKPGEPGRTIDEYLAHMQELAENYPYEELLSGQ
ncbi:MAG: hypothetical protein ACI4DW_07425 [Lachnospiraceae bacterium]